MVSLKQFAFALVLPRITYGFLSNFVIFYFLTEIYLFFHVEGKTNENGHFDSKVNDGVACVAGGIVLV